jgi:gliding motility-associated-like protein
MNPRALAILLLLGLYPLMLFGQNAPFKGPSLAYDVEKTAMIMATDDSLGLSPEDIPNFFTPNGDGVNDYFEVDTPVGKTYEFIVFTRTGTRVYVSDSPRVFWDGRTPGGEEVHAGVYYYVIRLSENKSLKGLSGFIYLYR